MMKETNDMVPMEAKLGMILQVGDNDLYSKKFNGHNLHNFLHEAGYESESVVFNKLSTDATTSLLAENNRAREGIYNKFNQLEKAYCIHGISNPFPLDLMYSRQFCDAGLIHYHLIHNYIFNLNYFPIICKMKPVVWSIHDPWPLTGHCVYPKKCERWRIGCGDCPDLRKAFSMEYDNTALNWEIKRDLLSRSRFHAIVASRWMYEVVNSSPVFASSKVHHVPYGLDLSIFSPKIQSAARRQLGIIEKAFVICFRSDANENKGLELIIEALKLLPRRDNIVILSVGQKGTLDELKEKFTVLENGWVFDDDELAHIYSASNIFLMPSSGEAFGMMAIESMACGVPVLTVFGTALPEVTNAPYCGAAVEAEAGAYCRELLRLIDSPTEMADRAHKGIEYVEKEYNKDKYVANMVSVYKEAIDDFRPDSRMVYIEAQIEKNMLKREIFANENSWENRDISRNPIVQRIGRKILRKLKRKD
jgi:glycosyltransferase involved in cell wall biosynthesis